MVKQQKSVWVYLIASLIIGLFVTFLIFLSQQDSGQMNIKDSASHYKDTREVRQILSAIPSKPEFDFYKMLPELPINVSPKLDMNIGSNSIMLSSVISKTQAIGSSLYYLQVGAFSKRKSAERRKVELILSNWPIRIQQVPKQGGGNIYRILVGPYNKGIALSYAEKGLRKQGLKPVRRQI